MKFKHLKHSSSRFKQISYLVLVVILMTSITLLAGCGSDESSSSGKLTKERKNIEKIETLKTAFDEATTYEEKVELYEEFQDKYGDAEFNVPKNATRYDEIYTEIQTKIDEYDEINSSLNTTLSNIQADYYSVNDFTYLSETVNQIVPDEICLDILETFFSENQVELEEAFTEYIMEDLEVSAYTFGFEFFKTSYEGTRFTSSFDGLFESESYQAILDSVNTKAEEKYKKYIEAGNAIKAQLDPLKTYEYTEVDSDGAYNAYLFGYANSVTVRFLDDYYFGSEYLFEIDFESLDSINTDQISNVSFIINGTEYDTNQLFTAEWIGETYYAVYTKFSTDGQNTISIDLFKAFVQNTGNLTVRLTMNDGSTQDHLINTDFYAGDDIAIIKNVFGAMEAVYQLTVEE